MVVSNSAQYENEIEVKMHLLRNESNSNMSEYTQAFKPLSRQLGLYLHVGG